MALTQAKLGSCAMHTEGMAKGSSLPGLGLGDGPGVAAPSVNDCSAEVDTAPQAEPARHAV